MYKSWFQMIFTIMVRNIVVFCCTRPSVGMNWDWVQGGDPLYAAVFSLSSCHSQFGHFFFAKSAGHIYYQSRRKKIGVQILFWPPQIGWFLRAMSLSQNWGSFFQNWGPASVMKPLAFAAAGAIWNYWNDMKLLYQNWGPALNTGKATPPESNRLF